MSASITWNIMLVSASSYELNIWLGIDVPSDVIRVTYSPLPPPTRYSADIFSWVFVHEILAIIWKVTTKELYQTLLVFGNFQELFPCWNWTPAWRHEHCIFFCWHHVQLFEHVHRLLLRLWCCTCCITNCPVLNYVWSASGRLSMSNIHILEASVSSFVC